ncbi:hypothetical protein PHYSODRAFT_526592 [Phytophthora sojae]|uniref:Protein kinase domain-containing protein n=1 Tax=Phytophthora sojae (strain P6497) TaxID=1094619 RepID=G5A7J2_PHYSP|nr:hypothetical protein PHYSODRAFT_526592 [Phytophthora sojae]EGZ08566.1 hypothetical protein PHYSODRAFT_526592 [Phytophthora sojae]|eukprot:XP_009536738.1 hypothetical protein PHYSODRAFT_526592 [Phytophthora sojae]
MPAIDPEALAAAASFCQQMREHELMCAHVCERLQQLQQQQQLQTQTTSESGPVVIASFASFLRKRRESSFVKRLANSRKVEEALRGFHEALDQLQQQQEEARDNVPATDWRRQWTSDRRAALQEFADLVDSAQVLEAEKSSAGFVEALSMLQFELQHKRDRYEADDDEVAAAHLQLMQRALRRLAATDPSASSSSSAAAAAAGAGVDVPEWFIPRDDVDFDSDASFDCGSYGSVHRGTWAKGATGGGSGSGAKVVVKCLLVDDAEAKRSFYKEVDVWRRLDHPHVLKLYGACHVSSPAFFVCDDATHGSFSDFLELDAGRPRRWQLFYEAALGLGYLHAEKVVHGDLKCTNLLVGSDYKAKLCDFGFSYVRSQSVGLSAKSQTEAIRWKAPECLAPPNEETNPQFNPRFASDVYSLGMCIVEAVQGEAPYGLLDDDEIMTRLFELEPYPRPADMQDDEWALVERMVQPDWSKRISLQDAIHGLKVFADREKDEGEEGEEERAPGAATGSTRVCAYCEARMPVAFAFCGDCGTAMTRQESSAAQHQKNACPSCEENVHSTDRFCRHCGYRLDADPAFA